MLFEFGDAVADIFGIPVVLKDSEELLIFGIDEEVEPLEEPDVLELVELWVDDVDVPFDWSDFGIEPELAALAEDISVINASR